MVCEQIMENQYMTGEQIQIGGNETYIPVCRSIILSQTLILE